MIFGIIYKATSPSGKVYIGQTIKNLECRIRNHFKEAFNQNGRYYNKKFSKAIRKYKTELIWEILHENILIDKLNDLEILEIKNYDSFLNGYNGTSGGYGLKDFKFSEESKRKMSISRKGLKRSQESKNNISKSLIGHIVTQETKNKISQSLKGKKASDEIKNKQSKTRSGVKYKKYTIQDSLGNVKEILGLYELNNFCIENNTSFNTLMTKKQNSLFKFIKIEKIVK